MTVAYLNVGVTDFLLIVRRARTRWPSEQLSVGLFCAGRLRTPVWPPTTTSDSPRLGVCRLPAHRRASPHSAVSEPQRLTKCRR